MVDSAAFPFQKRIFTIGGLWAAAEERPFFSGEN